MTEGLAGPEHADTFPPESSGTDGLHRAESAEKSEPEPSMRSHEPINVSNQEGQDEIPEGKPRKRKTFMSGYGSRSEDGDALSSMEEGKDVPDKQKFTAVGQLKATLFNSWINLLLIAAPVGSESQI